MGQAVVLYDEDCGLCRWAADRLRTWDRRASLAFAPIGSPLGGEALRSVDPDARRDSWHFVGEDGRVWSAGAAVPEVLRRLPGGRLIAPAFEASPGTTERVYGWVVRHRVRIGAALGQQACAVDPSRPRPGER